MDTEIIFYAICGAAALVMAVYYLRRRHKLSTFIFGAATGFLALLLVNRYGGALGVELPLNLFNLLGSIVLGTPFIAIMVLMRFL